MIIKIPLYILAVIPQTLLPRPNARLRGENSPGPFEPTSISVRFLTAETSLAGHGQVLPTLLALLGGSSLDAALLSRPPWAPSSEAPLSRIRPIEPSSNNPGGILGSLVAFLARKRLPDSLTKPIWGAFL